MSQGTTSRWDALRTPETRLVEDMLREVFPNTDAYRFNSASIRVRVVDPRFEGLSTEQRDSLVEPLIDRLSPEIQADIMNLLTLAPGEVNGSFKKYLANEEFEDPSESSL